MRKSYIKLAVLVGIFVIAALSFAIYQQFKTTTYENVVPESLLNEEKIEQITIRYCTPDENATNDKTMTLKDENKITQLLNQSKDMSLKKTSKGTAPLYLLEFKIVDERPRLLIVNDQDIIAITDSSKDYYQIIDDNKLIEIVEENEWKTIGKNEGSIESGTLNQLCP